MGPDHNDFLLLVRAGNFGNGVVLLIVVVVELVHDIQLQFDVLLLRQKARDSIPLFDRNSQRRHSRGLAGLKRSAGLYEDGSAPGRPAAVINYCQHFFFGQEPVEFVLELGALSILQVAERVLLAGDFVLSDIAQVLLAQSLVRRLDDRLYFRIRTENRN